MRIVGHFFLSYYMRRLISVLDKVPNFLMSGIVFLLIPRLTLDPQPIEDMKIMIFPGADKVVHALMFGGMAGVMCLDFQKRNWKMPISWKLLAFSCVFASILGIVIEYLQGNMNLGRTFEAMDIVADIIGAVLITVVFSIVSKRYLPID